MPKNKNKKTKKPDTTIPRPRIQEQKKKKKKEKTTRQRKHTYQTIPHPLTPHPLQPLRRLNLQPLPLPLALSLPRSLPLPRINTHNLLIKQLHQQQFDTMPGSQRALLRQAVRAVDDLDGAALEEDRVAGGEIAGLDVGRG